MFIPIAIWVAACLIPAPTACFLPGHSHCANGKNADGGAVTVFPALTRPSRYRCLWATPRLSEADKERLLLSEVGLTAFIVAEMRHFVNKTMIEFDKHLRYSGAKWELPPKDKLKLNLADENGTVVDPEYAEATDKFASDGTLAVDLICNTTQTAFRDGFRQEGLLSALGSAIIFFRNYYRDTPTLIAACERIGLSDYDVAHHITDMYHHRSFRGAYTKTLLPSGEGEIAARIAVGLDTAGDAVGGNDESSAVSDQENEKEALYQEEEDDECLLWSPTTPGVCLHWKSEDEAWRKRRFERIQMEGTRDPRRGGSGTTR